MCLTASFQQWIAVKQPPFQHIVSFSLFPSFSFIFFLLITFSAWISFNSLKIQWFHVLDSCFPAVDSCQTASISTHSSHLLFSSFSCCLSLSLHKQAYIPLKCNYFMYLTVTFQQWIAVKLHPFRLIVSHLLFSSFSSLFSPFLLA